MNIEPNGQHEIRRADEIEGMDAPLGEERERARARWLALTAEEAEAIDSMTPDERRAWLRERLPTKERLERHLRWLGLPVLAARARDGEFADFDGPHALPKNVLIQELRAAHRKAARKKGEHSDKALRVEELLKLVVTGEYDDTPEEGNAWAAKQTGEVRELLDRLTVEQHPSRAASFDAPAVEPGRLEVDPNDEIVRENLRRRDSDEPPGAFL